MSSRSYNMGQIVREMETNQRKIEDASVHIMLNKNSVIKNNLDQMRTKHDALYDQLETLTDEWLKELTEAPNERESN